MRDEDRDWKGEMLFDVSTRAKRDALLTIETGWISECKRLGFKAIEPDNIDSYTRSKRLLSADAAQSFMTMLAAEAHRQGLAVAQKNVANWVREPGQDGQLRAASVGFDFALVEECQLTGDCAALLAYYRDPKRVLEVEYWYDEENSSSGVTIPAFSDDHFIAACSARGGDMRIVLRNRDVRPTGAPGYVGERRHMASQICRQAASDPRRTATYMSRPLVATNDLSSTMSLRRGLARRFVDRRERWPT